MDALITGTDFVAIPSQDLPTARRFYGEVLGLPESAVYQREGTPVMGVEFETGNLTLSVVDVNAIGREFSANCAPVALHVDDMEAARTALEARGVTFFGDATDTGVCHMSHFKDPDGNTLMLHHRYAPQPGR